MQQMWISTKEEGNSVIDPFLSVYCVVNVWADTDLKNTFISTYKYPVIL